MKKATALVVAGNPEQGAGNGPPPKGIVNSKRNPIPQMAETFRLRIYSKLLRMAGVVVLEMDGVSFVSTC